MSIDENFSNNKRTKATIELRSLTHGIKRYIDGLAESQGVLNFKPGKGVSGTNFFILMYLYENRYKDVFQKDLEEEMNVRRSTISKVLKMMEEKGMIRREQVEQDARLKKIVITEDVKHKIQKWNANFKTMENQLFKGFTDEELDQFYHLIHKAKQNIAD